MRYQFKSADLDRDIEKIKDYDEITITKDLVEDHHEPLFYIDVNDVGYSYVNKEDRDKDYDHLLKSYLSNELQNYKRREAPEGVHPVVARTEPTGEVLHVPVCEEQVLQTTDTHQVGQSTVEEVRDGQGEDVQQDTTA